jgi:hypothetical protein
VWSWFTSLNESLSENMNIVVATFMEAITERVVFDPMAAWENMPDQHVSQVCSLSDLILVRQREGKRGEQICQRCGAKARFVCSTCKTAFYCGNPGCKKHFEKVHCVVCNALAQ